MRLTGGTLEAIEQLLRAGGCPVCVEMEQATSEYLKALASEPKGRGSWPRLQRTGGLCRQHARTFLLEVPPSEVARMYRWLARELLSEAGWSAEGTFRLPVAGFRPLLKPEGMCLACDELGEYQRAVVRGLLEALAPAHGSELGTEYRQGDGLCLAHLRLALGMATAGASGRSSRTSSTVPPDCSPRAKRRRTRVARRPTAPTNGQT